MNFNELLKTYVGKRIRVNIHDGYSENGEVKEICDDFITMSCYNFATYVDDMVSIPFVNIKSITLFIEKK